MRSVFRSSVFASVALFVAMTAAAAGVEFLKEEPAKGTLRRGDVVYVDDGKCPAGQVKMIIGGNQQAGAPRQVTCVKRPE